MCLTFITEAAVVVKVKSTLLVYKRCSLLLLFFNFLLVNGLIGWLVGLFVLVRKFLVPMKAQNFGLKT